jgi:hypothetical protein
MGRKQRRTEGKQGINYFPLRTLGVVRNLYSLLVQKLETTARYKQLFVLFMVVISENLPRIQNGYHTRQPTALI